jgi:hypothetical protein
MLIGSVFQNTTSADTNHEAICLTRHKTFSCDAAFNGFENNADEVFGLSLDTHLIHRLGFSPVMDCQPTPHRQRMVRSVKVEIGMIILQIRECNLFGSVLLSTNGSLITRAPLRRLGTTIAVADPREVR